MPYPIISKDYQVGREREHKHQVQERLVIADDHRRTPELHTVTVEGYNEAPADDPDQVADKMFPDYSTSYTVEAGVPIVIDVPLAE